MAKAKAAKAKAQKFIVTLSIEPQRNFTKTNIRKLVADGLWILFGAEAKIRVRTVDLD